MFLLKFFAYAAFALAALFTVFALSEGVPIFLAASISLTISGALFLAVDQVIVLLTSIRDRLPAPAKAQEAVPAAVAELKAPTRSIAEVQADIDRLKKGV